MTDKSDRLDILNRDRFMDVVCGDVPADLGFVSGTYRNQPSEFLVMIITDPDEQDVQDDEDIEVTTIPLAVFLSDEDLSYIEIPNGADITSIEFTEQPEDLEEDEEEDLELELLMFKPKGPPN
jgi:hypothetical protein